LGEEKRESEPGEVVVFIGDNVARGGKSKKKKKKRKRGGGADARSAISILPSVLCPMVSKSSTRIAEEGKESHQKKKGEGEGDYRKREILVDDFDTLVALLDGLYGNGRSGKKKKKGKGEVRHHFPPITPLPRRAHSTADVVYPRGKREKKKRGRRGRGGKSWRLLFYYSS